MGWFKGYFFIVVGCLFCIFDKNRDGGFNLSDWIWGSVYFFDVNIGCFINFSYDSGNYR